MSTWYKSDKASSTRVKWSKRWMDKQKDEPVEQVMRSNEMRIDGEKPSEERAVNEWMNEWVTPAETGGASFPSAFLLISSHPFPDALITNSHLSLRPHPYHILIRIPSSPTYPKTDKVWLYSNQPETKIRDLEDMHDL